MKLTKKQATVCILLTVLWLAAVGLASAFDLEISRAIADEHSIFGKLLEVLGEPPAILFASFNFALMAAYYEKKQGGARDRIRAVLSAVGCIGTAVYCFFGVFGYLADYQIAEVGILPTVLAGALVSAAFLVLTCRMKSESLKKYFATACHTVLAAFLALVIIWCFKLTWGRVRPRQLNGDISLFTPWYLPRGFTGYFSFPSGHTANATVIFSVTYYLKFLPARLARIKPVICALLGVWIALVAFSRVCVGAHYLSDVLFGMAITFAIVYFSRPR